MYKPLLLLLLMFACSNQAPRPVGQVNETITPAPSTAPPPLPTDGFDFPVGKPDAKGYYNAQRYRANNHLGEDWNAVTGGNTDLGDPVYAIAHGQVAEATDYRGGWGNVIRIKHHLPQGPYRQLESLYAHCDTVLVRPGQWVTRGQQIGTIGTAHGAYWAHLHLELRWKPDLPLGGGYGTDTTGFLNPTAFIRKHRK